MMAAHMSHSYDSGHVGTVVNPPSFSAWRNDWTDPIEDLALTQRVHRAAYACRGAVRHAQCYPCILREWTGLRCGREKHTYLANRTTT